MILAFLYLLFVTLALGFSLWKILDLKEDDPIAASFLYIATGLVIFVHATVVLGYLHLSSWFSYVVLSIGMLAITSRKGLPKFEMPKISKEWIIIAIIFIAHFGVYASGALSYSWLEDDDPWVHAAAVRFVSNFNTYLQPDFTPIKYLAPYSYFYDVLMGTLFQLNSTSIEATLKIFNALLVSLAIPFFYCWIKERIPKREALWATFIIAILPSFMSHFIWAQSLSIILVFPALYFFERYRKSSEKTEKKNFMIMTILTIATTLITQGSTAAMFTGLIVLYMAAIVINDHMKAQGDMHKIKAMAGIFILAVLLAVVEFWIPMTLIYSFDKVVGAFTLNGGTILVGRYSDTGGGVIYSPTDFLIAPFASKIDQPTGLGIFATILLLVGIGFCLNQAYRKSKDELSLVMLFIFAYTLVGTMGYALPVHLVPHRFWVFLSIPVAILGGMGAVWLLDYIEKNKSGLLGMATVIIVLGLLWSSAYPKYIVETAQWPPGVSWLSQQQLSGYIGLKALPPNTKVFNFCNNEIFTDGVDKFGYSWVKEVWDYKMQSINDSEDGNYAFLKKYGYDYAIIDQSCLKTFDNNQIMTKLNSLAKDSRFSGVSGLSNQGFITIKIS